jgi:hypothetical protein
MLIHDELKIVRHTLDVLHKEVEYLRMSIRDLGIDDVDYETLVALQAVMAAGVKIKEEEQKLMRQL